MAEGVDSERPPAWWGKVVAAVRAWLRQTFPGLAIQWTEADIQGLLREAAKVRQEAAGQAGEAFSLSPAEDAAYLAAVEAATLPRHAHTFSKARAAAMAFRGKTLRNANTGMEVTVSRNSLDKMLSRSAAEKSVSPQAHSAAVANLDHLFAHAQLLETRPDRKGDIKIVAIHRLIAPMVDGGKPFVAKLTVKEYHHEGQRLYTVEVVEIGTPALVAPADAGIERVADAEGSATTPQAGVLNKVAHMAQIASDARRTAGEDIRYSLAEKRKGADPVVWGGAIFGGRMASGELVTLETVRETMAKYGLSDQAEAVFADAQRLAKILDAERQELSKLGELEDVTETVRRALVKRLREEHAKSIRAALESGRKQGMEAATAKQKLEQRRERDQERAVKDRSGMTPAELEAALDGLWRIVLLSVNFLSF